MNWCAWCGLPTSSFLYHICPDGADFETRTQWGIEGKKAKYMDAPKKDSGRANWTLTAADKAFLKSNKIKVDD